MAPPLAQSLSRKAPAHLIRTRARARDDNGSKALFVTPPPHGLSSKENESMDGHPGGTGQTRITADGSLACHWKPDLRASLFVNLK